jgi:hypothetical protein
MMPAQVKREHGFWAATVMSYGQQLTELLFLLLFFSSVLSSP